ncbi:MAG: hypothetical protein HY876_04095 [Coriobacteriales bacterium]|nr:hypothetical protein [Coriobacteriales bacterium]
MRVRLLPLLAALVVSFAVSLAIAPAALAVGFATLAPGSGATVSAVPSAISIAVADTVPLLGTPVVTVGGVSKPVTVAYAIASPGYWEYDDEEGEYYWVEPTYDYKRATVSASPGTLGDGAQSVSVTMPSGNSPRTYSWSFTVQEKPMLSTTAPASGATVYSATPAITVKATDNSGVTACSATIDGASVPASYDGAAKLVRVSAPALSNASHTVAVTASDAAGNSATRTFSFTVRAPVTTWSGHRPAKGATLATPPTNTAVDVACSENLVRTSASIRVDGAARSTSVYMPDAKHATLIAALPSSVYQDGTHTVSASIATELGTTSTETWTFLTATPPTIGTPDPAPGPLSTTDPDVSVPVSDNSLVASWDVTVDGQPAAATLSAGRLHIALPQPLEDDASHTFSLTVRDGLGLSATRSWTYSVQTNPEMPLVHCSDCHDKGTDHTLNADDCLECHYVSPHEGTPSDYHRANVSACRPCHVSSLSVEHNRRTDAEGDQLTSKTSHR